MSSFEKQLAICMATHERLGADSALNVLDHNMLQEVCRYAHDKIRRDIQYYPRT